MEINELEDIYQIDEKRLMDYYERIKHQKIIISDLQATSKFLINQSIGTSQSDVLNVLNYYFSRLSPDKDLRDLALEWIRANTAAVDAPGGGVSFENGEELDFTLTYSDSCLEYETYATNYVVGWRYYDYPDNPSDLLDTQEMFASLSWPEICPAGVVPSYTVVRMWKSKSGHPVGQVTNDLSGWVHILGLGYDLPVEDILPDLPEQILHLSLAMVWNEGAGAALVDHDYSHTVFGISTDFDLGNNLTLTPGIYHQNTPEKSVNPDEDLTYATVGVKWAF